MARFVALTIALLAVLAVLAAPAAPAAGAGRYAGSDVGAAGVTVRGLDSRYVAKRDHGGTVVTQVDRGGGRIRASRVLPGRLVVPAVAFDGSATGLSADATTLVLAAPRDFDDRTPSAFTVLDTKRLTPRTAVTLRGDFTLDAISPDGNRLYLIQSTSPDDLTRYAVRAYDVAEHRLLPGAVVDKEEADEPMRGVPIARAMSRHGRWAYTLYDDAGGHDFIHALDTVAGAAKCIDLDSLAGHRDPVSLRLAVVSDGSIEVRDPGRPEPLLVVDASSFAVRDGATPGWLAIVAKLLGAPGDGV
jgi:hypothetical protein